MQAITDIDQVLVLPSVSYRRRDLVPDRAGLYFFVCDDESLLYIGMSRRSIRHRVGAHHRVGMFVDLELSTRIAFLVGYDDPDLLTLAERRAILALRPRFNTQWKRPPPFTTLNDGQEKTVVTTTVAAEMLRVSRAAVHKAMQDGRIAGVQFGRDYLIEREEVERYRRERKLTGPRRQQPAP